MKRPRRASVITRSAPERLDLGHEEIELAKRFEREKQRIDQAMADSFTQLEQRYAAELADLDRRKLVELAKLWRRAGRQLGAGMLRALGDLGSGWRGGPDVST